MRYVFIFFIQFYRVCISPFFPPACRFQPTCSQYAVASLKKYGLYKGGLLALRRLLRCHPWGDQGYDPIN